MNKIITAAVATAILGISSVASADAPEAPSIYSNGPVSPRLNMTDMYVKEKTAYSLMEALMQSQEAQIYAKGRCIPSTTGVDVLVDEFGSSFLHIDEVTGLKLNAIARNPLHHFGQNIDVQQDGDTGLLNRSPIEGVKGRYTFNEKNNMMVNERTSLAAKGRRGGMDKFRSSVIKDFYKGGTYGDGSYYELFDYGIQALSKSGYPVNKYWQRSKAIRDNGEEACTVFVKDRLVGSSACRITVSLTGYSAPDIFDQQGTIKVEKVTPSTSSAAMAACKL